MATVIFLVGFLLVIVIAIAAVVVNIIEDRSINKSLEKLAQSLDAKKTVNGYVGNYEGIEYSLCYSRGSRFSPSCFSIAVNFASHGKFKILEEAAKDRFFKQLGVACEIQTGEPSFDSSFYFECDLPKFLKAYFADSAKRASVAEIFSLGFNKIELTGKTLAVTKEPFAMIERPLALWKKPLVLDSSLVLNVIGKIKTLSENLPPNSIEQPIENTPEKEIKRVLFFCICLGILLAGLLLTLVTHSVYTPFDFRAMAGASLLLSVPSIFLFLALGLLWFKGRSTSHKGSGFRSAITFTVIGFPLFCFGILGSLNGFLDTAETVVRKELVVEKHYRSGKGGKKYYVKVASWRENRFWESIRVGNSYYNATVPGKTVIILHTKPGKFKYEWLEGYK